MILRRQMPLLAQEHRPIWQADLAAGQSLKEASYHYLVTDHLGTPVLALNKAGEATWKARYEAFGKARIDNASTAQINLRLQPEAARPILRCGNGAAPELEPGLYAGHWQVCAGGSAGHIRGDECLPICL